MVILQLNHDAEAGGYSLLQSYPTYPDFLTFTPTERNSDVLLLVSGVPLGRYTGLLIVPSFRTESAICSPNK